MGKSKWGRWVRVALFLLFAAVIIWSASRLSSGNEGRSPRADLQLRAMRDLLLPDAPSRPPRRDRPPAVAPEPTPIELVTTEALETIGAAEYHAWGYDGSGAKVAVIDEGFYGLDDLIQASELPPDVVTRRFDRTGAVTTTLSATESAHGTACTEIIHDVAPGAQLYLVEVEDLIANLDAIFDYLAREGVQIVSISMAVAPRHRGDGRGLLGNPPIPAYQTLARARREQGMLVIKSAGNDAQRHYSGRFSDADGNGWHAFGLTLDGRRDETLAIQVRAAEQVDLYLRWDDWGDDPLAPQTQVDYDLHLFDSRGHKVQQSAEDQAGANLPVDTLTFTPETSGIYHVRIKKGSEFSKNHRLHLTARQGVIAFTEHAVSAESISPPADASTVLAVGAVRVYNDVLAPYSAHGPTADGRIKPDLVSYSDVPVASSAYPDGFSGTSAAAPHVAGMAALLLNHANGTLGPHELEARLLDVAADKGPAGKDNGWGAGLAQLPPLNAHVQLPASARRSCYAGEARLYIPVTVHRSDGTPLVHLTRPAFGVEINGRQADLLTVRYAGDRYLLEVRPGEGLGAGMHDLTVDALGESAQETVSLPRVEADPTALYFDVRLAPQETLSEGTPLRFQASLSARVAITDAWVRGVVERPGGPEETLTLFDDGLHHDGVAGDGVYGGTYARLTVPGTFRFAFVATGSLPMGEAFEADAEVSIEVEAIDRFLADEIPDVWERATGLDPWGGDAYLDPDSDGLLSIEEYRAGSDPRNRDTDGDGLSDAQEVNGYYATDPANPDTDLGGVSDAEELRRRTNPLDPTDDARPSNRIYLPLRLQDKSTD